jgi:hypothetical protein
MWKYKVLRINGEIDNFGQLDDSDTDSDNIALVIES